MCVRKMVSIRVFNFNEDQLDILKRLYKRHLIRDHKWHFFWEGSYTVIRCQNMFARKVERFLKYHKFEAEFEGDWVDNIPITKKYQAQFEEIFHGFSVIAMKSNDKEVDELIDRVIHCFLNNMTTVERRDGDYVFWEPMKIVQNALQRAVFIGQIIERSRNEARHRERAKISKS